MAGIIVLTVILLFYPLIGCNQGVDLADTGYNIATYRFMTSWDGYWTLAMFLANALGYLLTCLPGGSTLLGLNIYTGLILGAGAVLTYHFLSRKLPRLCVFVGELIALGLCWCPSSILYNYLTYLMMLAAIGVLYAGLTKRDNRMLLLAGVILGINVFVRFSNLTQMAFILAVWFYVLGSAKWDSGKGWFATILRPTLWCIGGYAAGALAVLLMIAVTIGLPYYVDTILRLGSMSKTSEGYSALSMLVDAWKDYASVVPWLILMAVCVVAGMILFRLFGEKSWRWVKIAVYCGGLLVLIRLLWGRRILDTDYYSIGSVWYFANMLVVLAYVVNGICLLKEREDRELQLLSVFSLITLLIAPLGTNNHAYATINDLFLAAPVTVFLLYRYCIRGRSFPVRAMVLFFLVCITWQTIGFHAFYVFGDSSSYEKRDTKIENNAILKGIVTTRRKALNLESLSEYLAQHELQDKPLYLYGNIPGLAYYLDQKPATPMLWPDVESYEKDSFKNDLDALKGQAKEDRPLFVISIAQASIADGQVTYLGEAPQLKELAGYKLDRIYQFMEEENYTRTFQNELFVVYE